MDYGKFKYQEQKRAHEAKLKQKQIQVKEVKFRPGTDEGDYQIKLRNLTRFLTDGDKTKITLRFRGREMAHQELGVALLKRVEADLAGLWPGRAVAQAGRAPDDHDPGAEEEALRCARGTPGRSLERTQAPLNDARQGDFRYEARKRFPPPAAPT